MGLRITTNVPAINATRNLANSQRLQEKAANQLSSGYRINKSADDAAGLAISESMKAQIRSSIQARRNANDGISLIQVAEGGLSEVSNTLTRIRELGIQAASDTVGDRERALINLEVKQLKSEIDRTAQNTKWSDTHLLNGDSKTFDFQVGVNATEFDNIAFDSSKNVATLDGLNISDVDMSSKEGARGALAQIDEAQNRINGMRADIGSLQNRLTSTVDTLAVTEENLAAANSRIRDTDIAAATAESARNQVLLQAGTAALAQANQTNQLALKLLG